MLLAFIKTKLECYKLPQNRAFCLRARLTGHFARECRIKGTQDNRRRDAWNSGNKDGSRTGQKEDSKALVTIDGEGVDWTNHSEDEDYALMACNSSDSDTEVISCSNKCKESYANLKKLYDAQREQLSDASIEIKAYSQGLKKVEAQLVAHQQGQLWYEQKIKFMKIDLDDKTDVLTYHKKLLAEAQKEKEDLKAKVEKWHNSSKNLSKLLNTQMSANDKFGLGYGDHKYDAEGMHAVPLPITGNYMPSGPDVEIDDSKFTYGPKQTQPSESESQSSEFDTCESNISAEPSELVSEPVVNESNVECQPKVWSDAPIIEEYESDSEDEYVTIPTNELETPSFANKQVKTPRETVKNQFTHSQKPKVDKTELGYGFTVRACFVCGSLNHLIRDCDFHEKRMAKKAELKMVVLTRTGKIPVIIARTSGTKNVRTARHIFNKHAVLTSTAMKVNTLVLLGEKGKLLLSPQQVVIGDHKDTIGTMSSNTMVDPDYPHRALKNKGIVDSGCSRHMTGNKAYLDEFQDFNGGPVAFGGSRGYITGKGKIKTRKLDFEDVCFVKELQHFNLFSVSQICDKKNKVLFTDSECLVLSPEFKLPDENQVLLKIPRQNNMYSFNLENIVPTGGLACLIAKATTDESNKWHRRLGHVNFKNLNKLVKGNLVRGLPSKIFQNDHTCVACQKGKQHQGLLSTSKPTKNAGTEEIIDVWDSEKEDDSAQDCFVLPIWPSYSSTNTPALATDDKREGPREEEQVLYDDLERLKSKKRKLMRKLKLSGRNLRPVPVFSEFLGLYEIQWWEEVCEGREWGEGWSSVVRAWSCISRGLQEFRELLSRVTNGTEALLLPTLFFLWLDKVSTVSANKMAVLDSCPKHNMVAYLEKSEGNEEFHEIIDFLKRRSKQLVAVSVPLDHFPVNTLTSKVFSFMVKKGKHFSGKTDSSPAQTSEVPIEHQPNPSPRPSPTTTIPAFIPETSGENLGDQAKEIQALKAQITKLKKQAKPVIKHHKAYLKSVSLKQRFPRKSFSKKHRVHKESNGSKLVNDRPIEGTEEQVKEHDELKRKVQTSTMKVLRQREGTEEKLKVTDWSNNRRVGKAEEERNKSAEENAAKDESYRDFDDMKARNRGDRLLLRNIKNKEKSNLQ
ncbi:ribonuclease H-like domain-containing protein [Tanacetum coccineum]